MKSQLGHQVIPEGTIEHDISIQGRYEAFSAELLRLSLLGIGAIGFIAINTVLIKKSDRISIGDFSKSSMIIALVCFGLSAVLALVHRYSVVEMLSWQVQSLRRDIRGTEKDFLVAENERKKRFKKFKASRYSLALSALFLALAGISLAIGFGGLILELN